VDALRDPRGVSPGDAISFYDIAPLRNAGVDGSGITVMFPEWVAPTNDVLNAYATRFNLSPFKLDVRTDPSWGAPLPSSDRSYFGSLDEATMDVEIVHGIAPGAHEVVYAVGDPTQLPQVLQTMFKEHPNGIVSSSVRNMGCEPDTNQQQATAFDDVIAAGAANGATMFQSTGDRGAYPCITDGGQTSTTLAVNAPSASPHLTSVGGTQAYFAANGQYFREAAWGEPIEAWGGGGGISTFFQRPSWQQAPGVPADMSGRGIPDIAADADNISSGWDIVGPSQDDPTKPNEELNGGTSAASPFWASIAALIDQDLQQKQLPLIGFANPALYTFAQSPQGLPAPAFHDITLGSNLHFAAGPGWDAATGLGSPDVAALADDFEWYGRTHHGT
jgi:kumamolisin